MKSNVFQISAYKAPDALDSPKDDSVTDKITRDPRSIDEHIKALVKSGRYHHQLYQELTKVNRDLKRSLSEKDELLTHVADSAHLMELSIMNERKFGFLNFIKNQKPGFLN